MLDLKKRGQFPVLVNCFVVCQRFPTAANFSSQNFYRLFPHTNFVGWTLSCWRKKHVVSKIPCGEKMQLGVLEFLAPSKWFFMVLGSRPPLSMVEKVPQCFFFSVSLDVTSLGDAAIERDQKEFLGSSGPVLSSLTSSMELESGHYTINVKWPFDLRRPTLDRRNHRVQKHRESLQGLWPPKLLDW